MSTTTEQNKAIVTRFNKEFIEQGNVAVFNELIADNVINRTAPAGSPNGKDGMFHFLQHILRACFSDLKVDIYEQIAEGDLVTTRKQITGTHTAAVMGIVVSGKTVNINVIDIIRIQNGQYAEHWGQSNLADVIADISA